MIFFPLGTYIKCTYVKRVREFISLTQIHSLNSMDIEVKGVARFDFISEMSLQFLPDCSCLLNVLKSFHTYLLNAVCFFYNNLVIEISIRYFIQCILIYCCNKNSDVIITPNRQQAKAQANS